MIKLYVTGEGLLRPGMPPEETMYSFDEIAVAVDEAHKRNRQVAAHVRGNDGVKLCVAAGVDVLEHATYADDEAIAMIAERKDDIFVVPGLGYHWGILVNGPACGITPEHLAATEYQEEWDLGCVAMDKLRKAGVRVIPGGDYGFVWCPHGQYAKDIELFVTDMGFSPMEAIVAATKHGAELLRLEHECGTIDEGKCADILVVDGDPLADIAILQDRSKLAVVMANGKVMVNTLGLNAGAHAHPGLPHGHRAHPEREVGSADDADGGGGAALNLDLNGHRAHVEEFGAGPPVVLVHGLGGTGAGIWRRQIADLAGSFRVVAYDLRGSGQSEVTPGPYTIDLLADDLRALVRGARARALRAGGAFDGRVDRARVRVPVPGGRARARRHRRAGRVSRPGARRARGARRDGRGRGHGRGRRDGRDERRVAHVPGGQAGGLPRVRRAARSQRSRRLRGAVPRARRARPRRAAARRHGSRAAALGRPRRRLAARGDRGERRPRRRRPLRDRRRLRAHHDLGAAGRAGGSRVAVPAGAPVTGAAAPRIAPWLSLRGGAEAVAYYEAAFGAVVLHRHANEAGEVVAQLSVGGAEFWVADDPALSPETLGGGSARFILCVDDPDALFARRSPPGARSSQRCTRATAGASGASATPSGITGRSPGSWPPISCIGACAAGAARPQSAYV